MRVVNLASGSKGNATFIESRLCKVLIDNGLSLADITERLSSIGTRPEEIDAILLTHEHIDHIGGVKYFLKKYRNVRVYIPFFVKNYCIKKVDELPDGQVVWYNEREFYLKDIKVSCTLLPHDSQFCMAYSLSFDGKKISYATDLGHVSSETLSFLGGSDILFIESNHDETMLRNNPRYPAITKKRILGPNGHISNVTCGHTLSSLVHTGVKQAILCHLSEENNSPILAYNTVKNVLMENNIVEGEEICVDVAYQHKVGTIFTF